MPHASPRRGPVCVRVLNGRAVLEVSEPLLHQQPLLETLSRLQLEIAEQEPILYEYFATTERSAFVWTDGQPRRCRDTVHSRIGDELLPHVAVRLAQFFPAEASPPCLYRLEGDTFALLVHAPEPRQAGREVARQLLEALEKLFYVEGRELFLSASAGISLFPSRAAMLPR